MEQLVLQAPSGSAFRPLTKRSAVIFHSDVLVPVNTNRMPFVGPPFGNAGAAGFAQMASGAEKDSVS